MNFEETYNKNMSYLKQTWPVIYDNILSCDISNYELTIEKNEEVNISVNSHKLYPSNVNESISKQVDAFLNEPTSYFRKPSWCHDSGLDYYHDSFVRDLEISSPYIAEKKNFKGYSHNLDGFIPLLVVFGVGLGHHIQQLLDKSKDISDLVIIDENYEFLKISMHIMDWSSIFQHYTENHRTLHFVIHPNSQENCHSLLNTIFGNFPYYFFNVYFITHYDSDFFNSIKEILLKKIKLGITGLGFYDDEVISLKHTIANIHDDRAIFKYTDKLPNESAALIIGSGPSIDDDIESIKKLQDKAVIFSCGTALKVLYAHGIVPDYHLEMERPTQELERIKDSLPEEYLKKVNIIGLNVVYPKVFDLFKSAKIFFRVNDAGCSISPSDIPYLDHCNPTVSNAALSFTSEIGFDNIFLFGTDMGFRNHDSHHSKSSDYYNGSGIKFFDDGSEEAKYQGNFDINEKFYSTDIFLWSKQRVENCIYDNNVTLSKQINYFNCSDGLAIERCTPIRANKIEISKDIVKNEVLNAIESSFDKDFDNIHKLIDLNYSIQLKIFYEDINSLKKLIKARKVKSFDQFFILMKRIFFIINHKDEKDKSFFSRSMLKGTTFHFISSVYTHALAGSNKESSLKYVNESLEKYLGFLELAKKEVTGFQSELLK